jgi:hypothetical protein
LLGADFVEQVMNQYEGRPEDMMKYVKGYTSGEPEDNIFEMEEVIEGINLLPPPGSPPPLQIVPPLL